MQTKTYIFFRTNMEGQRRSCICFLWWSSLIGICEGIRVESIVRGEALGFVEDELLRNHLPRTFVIDQERKLEREPVKRPPRLRKAPGA